MGFKRLKPLSMLPGKEKPVLQVVFFRFYAFVTPITVALLYSEADLNRNYLN